ncbi:putative O-methyltransferase [Whalleya microplaca]|nr:putative O-methyltransferase [Whalleya microplaca]
MASFQSRIAELAASISTHTQRIDSYLYENKMPFPSFDADGPIDLGLPPNLERSRNIVLEASQELNDLLQGPRNLILNHQHNQLVPLKFIRHFWLVGKVPENGEISYAELAGDIGVDCDALSRILRYGIAHRIYKEPRPGFIAHSGASRLIAVDKDVANCVDFGVDDMWPAAMMTVNALERWPKAERSDQSGFALANSTEEDENFYYLMRSDKELRSRFEGAWRTYVKGPEFAVHHLTDNYPWDLLGAGTVVIADDYRGEMATALALKYPDLHLIVQQVPPVHEEGEEVDGVNVRFMVQHVVTEQSVKDADVYLYPWIFNLFTDQGCVNILNSLKPALKWGSRVLVMDFVMPPPCTIPNSTERKLRALDIMKLEAGNLKERSIDEWKFVFVAADTRFVFKELRQPLGSGFGIIEFAWEG